jgi:hypothetical protein
MISKYAVFQNALFSMQSLLGSWALCEFRGETTAVSMTCEQTVLPHLTLIKMAF